MRRKLLLFLALLLIDLTLIHFVLRQDLASKDFVLIILFVYAVLFNFLLAGILASINKGDYSGLFILNAITMPLLMYLYT